MKKPNTKCQNCGQSYYVCHSCVDLYSWKHICCCIDCYRDLMQKKLQETEKNTQPKPTKKETKKKEQPIVEVEAE